MAFADRVTGFRRIRGADLIVHPMNPKTHPREQRDGLAAILAEFGIVGALVVYKSASLGGWAVLDGNCRTEEHPEVKWPCILTDVTDEEAPRFLATFDQIGRLAETDAAKLLEVLQLVEAEDDGLAEFLRTLEDKANELVAAGAYEGDGSGTPLVIGKDGEAMKGFHFALPPELADDAEDAIRDAASGLEDSGGYPDLRSRAFLELCRRWLG